MKLVHPEYTFQIKLEEGIVQRLIVENPAVMSQFIVDFRKQLDGQEGKWILSHEGQALKIHDTCELIVSIFDLEINQRKMLNALYDELVSEINGTELLLEWREINSNLSGFLSKAIDGVGYDISYEELEMKALFKALELKFRENDEGYVSYLLEYLQLMSEVRGINIFILVNITSFLEEKEIEYLYEQAFYKKYHLVLLDVQDISIDEKVERKIIIDKDYCVIDATVK